MSKTNCPGSSTLTDDGKACEVKLDFPLYCGLTNDSVPGWPRCYSNNGKAIQIPPKPDAAKASESPGARSPASPSKPEIPPAAWRSDRDRSASNRPNTHRWGRASSVPRHWSRCSRADPRGHSYLQCGGRHPGFSGSPALRSCRSCSRSP